MKTLDPHGAARNAISARPGRPATAILHDSPDTRLVVFRLAPGEQVAPHRSTSAVQLYVLHGNGFVTGEGSGGEHESPCAEGDVVVYAPNELHGMRADGDELMLLATITPRPGGGH